MVHYPCLGMASAAPLRIGVPPGPQGTFTEEALFSEADYADAEVVALGSLHDVLEAVEDKRVDLGFLPIENAIEGSVRDTLDSLLFDRELLIQREVVLDIHLHLMARPGTHIDEVRRVMSIPMATAQCRSFLVQHLPRAEVAPANSTADAARLLGEGAEGDVLDVPTAAIAPSLGGQAVRTRHPGRGRRGPSRESDPVRGGGPPWHTCPHRARPHHHCLLSAV